MIIVQLLGDLVFSLSTSNETDGIQKCPAFYLDVKRCLLSDKGAQITRTDGGFSDVGLGHGAFNAVSYTHLTLPTICSV